MKTNIAERARKRKRKLRARLDRGDFGDGRPVIGAGSRRYELSERVSATCYGGIGLVLDLLAKSGLAGLLDERLRLLKHHRPYHESDHVINLVLNFLCGARCLDDLEGLRQDPAFLNALGTRRIPDPTTAGDFLRRFGYDDNIALMDVINEVNAWSWKMAGTTSETAVLDVDGSILETSGERKDKMDISYTGKWGFHPLIITEALTRANICMVNRPGNQVSQQDAACWIEYAVAATEGHFKNVRIRGDTAFNLTYKFDEWDQAGLEFCFGCAATPNLKKIAENLPKSRWKSLRPAPANTQSPTEKARRIEERGFRDIRPHREHVAEFSYRPSRCALDYRVVVMRKTLHVFGGQPELFTRKEIRYFFYITNIREGEAEDIIDFIHGRCNHENQIEQLKNGLRAIHAPCADFQANQAWMLIGMLAHNIKSWMGLLLPDSGPRQKILTAEFKQFFQNMILIPCQILKTGRQIVFRYLAVTRHFEILLLLNRRLQDH